MGEYNRKVIKYLYVIISLMKYSNILYISNESNECIQFCGRLSELQDNNLPIIVLDLNKIVKDSNIFSLYPHIEIGLPDYVCFYMSSIKLLCRTIF